MRPWVVHERGDDAVALPSEHGTTASAGFDDFFHRESERHPGASSVLKIVDVRTGTVHRIAGNHRSAADFGTWSPDGRIAYLTGHEWTDNAYGFNPAEIWVTDPDGANPWRVLTLDSRAFGLAWTPSGELSFSVVDGDAFDTYELNPDTGQTTRITPGFLAVWLDDHTVIVQR
jgi:hypothetical protein